MNWIENPFASPALEDFMKQNKGCPDVETLPDGSCLLFPARTKGDSLDLVPAHELRRNPERYAGLTALGLAESRGDAALLAGEIYLKYTEEKAKADSFAGYIRFLAAAKRSRE